MRMKRSAAALVPLALACSGGDIADAPPRNPARVDSIVLIDEGHNNHHTAGGRYAPFAALLRGQGYTVRAQTGVLARESLASAGVLVISNALAPRNAGGDWSLPTPSAFADAEIAAVRAWVEDGGSLLLIADHMPFPGAAQDLGRAFGVHFNNGFAFDTTRLAQPLDCLGPGQADVFRRSDGTLTGHPVLEGRTPAERIDSVATFTGQAFQWDPGWEPLLLFGPAAVTAMPDTAWVFRSWTPRERVAGWAQGAVRRFGSGRIAVFGEAGMFTEQTCGPNNRAMGMNAPEAAQNRRLLLNLMTWLTS
jgi:hypothetical protein